MKTVIAKQSFCGAHLSSLRVYKTTEILQLYFYFDFPTISGKFWAIQRDNQWEKIEDRFSLFETDFQSTEEMPLYTAFVELSVHTL